MVCTKCGYDFKAPVSCGNRFCEVCSGPRRRRVRAKLSSLVDATRLPFAHSLRHLTLTVPNQTDLSAAHRHLVHSFRRLRQRAFWRNKVRGGAVVFELTGAPGTWHLHLHAIIVSRYLPHSLLVKHWKQVSGGIGVYITCRPPKVVLRYLTSYLSKCSLSAEHAQEASDSLKQSRIFSCFGTWHDLIKTIPPILSVCPKCGDVSWYPLTYLSRAAERGYYLRPHHHKNYDTS